MEVFFFSSWIICLKVSFPIMSINNMPILLSPFLFSPSSWCPLRIISTKGKCVEKSYEVEIDHDMGTGNLFFLRERLPTIKRLQEHTAQLLGLVTSADAKYHQDLRNTLMALVTASSEAAKQGQPKTSPEPSSWSSFKSQTFWHSFYQNFTSCRYRKLSWDVRVVIKNEYPSVDTICSVRIWSNFRAWAVTVEWYSRPSEIVMFPLGVFLLSASRNSSSCKGQPSDK